MLSLAIFQELNGRAGANAAKRRQWKSRLLRGASQSIPLIQTVHASASESILSLDCHSHRIPSAQAQSGNAAVDIPANHLVNQRDQHARAAGADGMS